MFLKLECLPTVPEESSLNVGTDSVVLEICISNKLSSDANIQCLKDALN